VGGPAARRAAMTAETAAPAVRGGWTRDLQFSPAVLLAGVLVLATALRVLALGRAGHVEADETFTVWIARHAWSSLPALLRLTDTHPPGFYVLMKTWIGAVGQAPAAIRLPSVALGVLSVFLTYEVMRRLTAQPTALLGALLVAVSPIQIMVSQQATAYALLTALTLGATLALLEGVQRGGVARWSAYGALAVCLAYTQYLGLLVVAVHGVWVAAYARRAFAPWLVSVIVVAAALVPWAPFLASQVGRVQGVVWYRASGAALNFGDLLGLFAFGGALFGTATYFYPGRVTVLQQAIVLLPFLVGCWLGLRALRAAPRAFALLVLVLGVPIGLGVALGFIRPVFTPRWFAFLSPFYTMVLARGIVAGAEALVAERHRAVAIVTLCLFLYSVPVLERYYSDPKFLSPGWRDVAAFVGTRIRPGDAFVFTTPEAEMRLLYYFPGVSPTLVLTPLAEIFGADRHAAFTSAEVEALAHKYPRVWVVITEPFYPAVRSQLVPPLRNSFRLVDGHAFEGAYVGLFEPRSGSP